MAQPNTNVGLQISLEISKIKPIRDLAGKLYTAALDYGRKCRLSGSDVVVEEDLVLLLGRVLVSPELEDEYRKEVQIQSFVQLHKGCEVRLDAGTGPTVQEALKNRERLATVIQLSMLAYFHNRLQLARALSRIIAKRHEAQIRDAQPSPGESGIAKVLEATSAQTCAFGWHIYSQQIEDKLRSQIPSFRYRPEYSRLSSTVILGAVDFFYFAQSLPKDRRITLSTESGCIPLVVWAHCILGLTVIVQLSKHDDIVFGHLAEPQVYIQWTDVDSRQELPNAEIRLHDRRMEVYIDLKGYQDENERRFPMETEERHSVRGYGTALLKRSLNISSLVPDRSADYEYSANFVTIYAIRCCKDLQFRHENYENQTQGALFRQPSSMDIGRIATVCQMVFEGIPFRPGSVTECLQYYRNVDGDLSSKQFPQSLRDHVKDIKGPSAKETDLVGLIHDLWALVKVIIALSWVKDFERIDKMPLLMDTRISTSKSNRFLPAIDSESRNVSVPLAKVSEAVLRLFSKAHETPHYAARGSMFYDIHKFLWSEFGWSMWLDGVFGAADPAEVNFQYVNVQQGVPTTHKTGERRNSIADGRLLPFKGYPHSRRFLRGETYRPRSVGTCGKRQEFWSVEEDHFELSIVYPVVPAAEWAEADGTEPFEMVFHCRDMFNKIADTSKRVYFTEPCEHAGVLDKSSRSAELTCLGPDAAVLLGWKLDDSERRPKWDSESPGFVKERVVVALTRGIPQLRWAAIKGCSLRSVLIVTNDCCEGCALTTASSLRGKWVLIL